MIRNTSGAYNQLSTDGFRLKNKHNKVILDASEVDSIAELRAQLDVPSNADLAINVRNFGAKGDGVTDDTAAIQAAEDYISKYIPNGTLLFPPRYRFAVSGSILKREKTNWTGGGEIVRQSPTGNAYPIVYAYEVNEWSIVGVRIEAAKFDEVTGAMGNFETDNVCVLAVGCENFAIRNVQFRRYLNGVRVVKGRWFEISGCDFDAETGAELETFFTTGTGGPAGTSHGDISCYLGYQSGWGSAVNNIAQSEFYVITNNRCRSIGLDQGIAISNQVYNPHPGVIANNVVLGKRAGIQIYTGSNTDQGNAYSANSLATVHGNLVAYCRETGIYLRGYTGMQILDNTVYRCARRGPFNSQTGGGIVVRVAPEMVFTSPTPDFMTPTVVRGNLVVDTGDPTAGANSSAACDGAIVARNHRMVIEDNVCIQSLEYGFDRSGQGIATEAGNGQKLGEFIIRNNLLVNFYEPLDISIADFTSQFTDAALMLVNNRFRRFGRALLYPGCPVLAKDNLFEDATLGLRLRGAPHSRLEGNQFRRCTTGLRFQDMNFVSTYEIAQAGVAVTNPGRGASIAMKGNDFFDCATPVAVEQLGDGLGGIYSVVCYAEGNTSDGRNIDSSLNGTSSGVPSATTAGGRTFEVGEKFYFSSSGPEARYSVCSAAGTAGAITGTYTATTDGTSVISCSSVTQLYAGCYINIAGVGNGPFKVLSVDRANLTAELSAIPDANVTAAAISYSQPQFQEASTSNSSAVRAVRGYLCGDPNVSAADRRIEYIFGSTGNFCGLPHSQIYRFTVPSLNPSAAIRLGFIGATNNPTSLPDDCLAVSIETSGDLTIRQLGTSGNERVLTWSGFVATHANTEVILGVTWPEGDAATNPVVYMNGSNITSEFTASTSGTPPNWLDAAMDTTYFLSHHAAPTGIFYPAYVAIGALSNDELATATRTYEFPDWFIRGKGDAAQLLLNGDFSSYTGTPADGTADTFTSWTIGPNIKAEAITGGLKISPLPGFVFNTSGDNLMRQPAATNSLLGYDSLPCRVKMIVVIRMRPIDGDLLPGSGVAVFSRRGSLAESGRTVICTTADWADYTVEILAGSATGAGNDFSIRPRADGAEIESIRVYRGGAMAMWDIQPAFALDDQRHRFSGLLSGILVASDRPDWRIIGRTNTNGNQQILGANVLMGKNRLDFWTIDNAGSSVTVSLGNESGGTQYANGITAGAGLSDATIATRLSGTAALWVASNGTDELTHTIKGCRLAD